MSTAWIDAAEAARILDVPDIRSVERLARERLIGYRTLPGVKARFCRADVEALARTATVPARPQEVAS